MKKLIIFILLIVSAPQTIFSQDLSNWVSGLALIQNAEYQQVDKAMLEASLAIAKTSDTTGIIANTPPFMEKLESIDIINLSSCTPGAKNLFLQDFENIKDTDGYETLINITEDGDKVRIIVKREETFVPHVFVFAIDGEGDEIMIIRMSGNMDESDIADIVKQQQK